MVEMYLQIKTSKLKCLSVGVYGYVIWPRSRYSYWRASQHNLKTRSVSLKQTHAAWPSETLSSLCCLHLIKFSLIVMATLTHSAHIGIKVNMPPCSHINWGLYCKTESQPVSVLRLCSIQHNVWSLSCIGFNGSVSERLLETATVVKLLF